MSEKKTKETCRIGIFNNNYQNAELALADIDFPRDDIEGLINGTHVIVPKGKLKEAIGIIGDMKTSVEDRKRLRDAVEKRDTKADFIYMASVLLDDCEALQTAMDLIWGERK